MLRGDGTEERGRRRTRAARRRATLFAPTASMFFQPGGVKRAGGAEAQMVHIARLLAARGWAVRFLTINTRPEEVDAPAGVEVRNMWNSSAPLLARVLGAVRSIAAAPSPIYMRSTYGINVFAALLARALGKRVVVGLASDLNCVRRPGETGWNLAAATVFRLSSQVIAQTRDQQELLRDSFGVRAAVWGNVVRPAPFRDAREAAFRERDIDVLWIGSVEPRKGVEQALELATLLPGLRFAIIGGPLPGAGAYCRRIMARAAEIDNVSTPGFVPPETLPDWLGRARLLLHTSVPLLNGLTKEGFPNVFLEAWASGVPVVSLGTDPDGLLAAGGLGWKCGSLQDAARVIERAARDEAAWESGRRRADEYVAGRDVENPAVQEAFEGLLTGRQAAR